MVEQQSLFGDLAPPREPHDRLFFALFPDTPTAARIVERARALRAQHGMTARVQDAARMHITLQHLGDFAGVPQRIVESASAAAATVAMAPFEVTFDRAASFGGNPKALPYVLLGNENAALKAFNKTLGGAMAKALLPPDATFTPHVTMLRDPVSASEQPIEPITWTVREFVLIHSLLGQTRHIPLGRWTLRG